MTVRSRQDGSSTAANFRGLLRETPNYDYVNARLRARTRDFLPRETLLQMSRGTLEAAEKTLRKSPYAQEFQNFTFPLNEVMSNKSTDAASRHINSDVTDGQKRSVTVSALSLENLVARETEARYDDLKTWAKGEARLLLSVLGVQSDLENGMLFLRSCANRQTGYIPFLPVCGELSSDFFKTLGSARGDRATTSEICRLEPSDFSDMLDAAVTILDSSNDISEAEWFYMKEIFSWARDILEQCGSGARPVRQCFDYTVDLWNIRTWLGLHGGHKGSEIHFLEGGTLRREDLLFAKRLKNLLRGTFWQLPASGEESEGTSLLALDKKFLAWQISLRRQDPLGAQVMISYLAQLYCEWRNLFTILEGLRAHVPCEVLQSVLLP